MSRRQYGYIREPRTKMIHGTPSGLCKRDSLPSEALVYAKRTKQIPKAKGAVRSKWDPNFGCSNSRCRWDWDSYGPVCEGIMLANDLKPGSENMVRHKIAQ